jgi:hypothetical protein
MEEPHVQIQEIENGFLFEAQGNFYCAKTIDESVEVLKKLLYHRYGTQQKEYEIYFKDAADSMKQAEIKIEDLKYKKVADIK